MKGFTIFIPVYNEEKLIEKNTIKLVKHLDSLKIKYEVIIGSNGSDDKTVVLGKKLEKKNKNIRFFHLNRKGVGRAFVKAISMSKFEFIISLDMDLSTDIDYVKKAVDLSKDYDIIIGSKYDSQERSIFRRIPSFIFTLMTRVLMGLKYKDYSLAAKTYRKSILVKNVRWIDEGTSYVINIIYMAKRQGYKMIEIPVVCEDTRKSKFNILHEAWYRFLKLMKLRFAKK